MIAVRPIRVNARDSEAQVAERHAKIEQRLNDLGAEEVKRLIGYGLPEEWSPIVQSWLKGERV